MSSLYERIESLCESKGINITIMCRESGASRGSFTDLKKGRKKSLSHETLTKIADYFGVSTDYIVGREEKNKPSDNRELPEGYVRFLGRDGKVREIKTTPEMIALLETMPNSHEDL